MDLNLDQPRVLLSEVGLTMDVDYALPNLMRAMVEETSIRKVSDSPLFYRYFYRDFYLCQSLL
jgi:hypothetical protein